MAWKWHLDKLLTPRAVHALEDLMDAVETMLGSECLKDGIEEILKMTPNDFKAKSNEGHAWYKRRRVDFGNYRYSVLYQL